MEYNCLSLAAFIALKEAESSPRQFETMLDRKIDAYRFGDDFYDEYGAIIRTLAIGIHRILQFSEPMAHIIVRDMFDIPEEHSPVHKDLKSRCSEFTENGDPNQKAIIDGIFDPDRKRIPNVQLKALYVMADKFDFQNEARRILKHIEFSHYINPARPLLLPQLTKTTLDRNAPA